MLARLGKVRTIPLLLQQRQQLSYRRADIADNAEIDRGTAADLLRPNIDLSDAHGAALRVELAVRKIGPKHQHDIAIEHRVVAGRKADQPGHADIERVVPLDMFLA